jgi:predicted nucleic acid-binding protein
MSWLLDVNLVLATRWTTHPDHAAARAWLDSLPLFHTTPISELGFVRVSLTAAYGATWEQIQASLKSLQRRPGYRFLVDDVDGTVAPATNSKETTDAHLVTLARRHGLKLGTLDEGLIIQGWARGIAVNPLTLA